MPSNAYDAKGLLRAAIYDDNPVIFVEHKLLYRTKGEVPEESYEVALGKSKVVREGADLTLVATSIMVSRSLQAAEELAKQGVEVEIIDPRTIKPLDAAPIIESVKKTGKALVVHEAVKMGGFGGEVVSQIVESEAFDYLEAPAARRLARELGIDLSSVEGSGPRGRVQSWDVQAAQEALPAKAAHSAPEPAAESGIAEVIPLQGMRRTIARRMQVSTQQAPHITFNAEIDVTAIEELRHRLNTQLSEGQARVSITAILVKACAWALRRNPRMNARLEEERILVLSDINVGVAVALDDGLIVPVIHHAEAKGILELAAEVTAISRRAHSAQLHSQDLLGGTFTISNLGMFGVDSFTAIINPPETGILAVGRIIKRLVVTDEEEVEIRPMMMITLSADHRTVDGAVAAHFLNDLRAALEYPALMTM